MAGTTAKPLESRKGKQPTERQMRRRPKLNALQRHQRGRRIAAMRAQHPKPVAWKDIAAQVGMSEAGVHDAYEQFLIAEESMLENPLAVVDETIDVLTVAMHEALATYGHAREGTSVRVQALRTAVDTAVTRLQVMRAAGRAPRSLAGPSIAQQMSLLFRSFAEILRKYDVGDDALRELLELAESQAGRLATVEGRELPQAGQHVQ